MSCTVGGCTAAVNVGIRCLPHTRQLAVHRDLLNAEFARLCPQMIQEPNAGRRARRGRPA